MTNGEKGSSICLFPEEREITKIQLQNSMQRETINILLAPPRKKYDWTLISEAESRNPITQCIFEIPSTYQVSDEPMSFGEKPRLGSR